MPRLVGREPDGYGWLLWLYPRDLREEFGDEMQLLAAEIVRDRAHRGRVGLALDLLVAVPRTRSEQIMRRPLNPTYLIITLAMLTVSLVILTVVLGLGPVGAVAAGLLAALVIGLAVGQRSQLARSLQPEQGHVPVSVGRVLSQGWWAPLAALEGTLTILFGVQVGLRTDGVSLAGSLLGTAVTLAFGAAVLAGLVLRLRRPALGSGLILVGTVWFGLAFWMVWPPALTALVWVGVIASAITSARRTPHAA